MRAEIEAEYKLKLREFMSKHGAPVQFQEKRYEWQDDDDVSTYGWHDWDKVWHTHERGSHRLAEGCHWIVPEGAELIERTYSQFNGTFTDNNQEVGINVSGCHCACGKYTDVTLRYVGTLTEVLHSLLGLPDTARFLL
jgi:hypothetical protein